MRAGLALAVVTLAVCPLNAAPKAGLSPAAELNEPGQKKVSDEAQTVAKRALTAFQKGDLAGAKKEFQKVLQLAPDNVPTLVNLGLVEHRQKNFAEAEVLLGRAVRGAPDSALPWLVLGIVRYDSDKLDAALAALAQAVWLAPKDARTHHYFGATLGRKGWYSGAEDEMRRAIELEPGYADAHFNLAMLYLQRVPPAVELARRHYHRAVELGAAPDDEVEKKLAAE